MRRIRVRLNDLAIHFINVNTQMKLRGHSHFARVSVEFESEALSGAPLGYPSFDATNKMIHAALLEATAAPLRDHTNEQVAFALFDAVAAVAHNSPAINAWGAMFALVRLELAVYSIRDDIGHADGVTTYIVEEGDV